MTIEVKFLVVDRASIICLFMYASVNQGICCEISRKLTKR